MTTNETLKETMDVIEETLDTLDRIPTAHLNGTTKKQQIIILVTVAVAGALAGGGVSHILTKRKLTTKFNAVLEEEIFEAKKFYSRLNKYNEDGTPITPQQILEENLGEKEIVDTVRSYQGKGHVITEAPVATEEELLAPRDGEPDVVLTDDGGTHLPADEDEVNNIWDGHEAVEDDVWDPMEELANREPGKPYILSHEEYYMAEQDFEQAELTYFEGGRTAVLVDDQSVPVQDVEKTVGEANLLKFGHGSHDANMLYIRNEQLKCDFEITRSYGSFAQEVLGIDDSDPEDTLQHSMRRPRKMRASDE